ncbi:14919_t:CDS:1, partial [Gigaspora margarita]
KIKGAKGKEVSKIAERTLQLYCLRWFYNLLGNKFITARTLYRMSKDNFEMLLREARKIRNEELSEIFRDLRGSSGIRGG